MTTDIKERDLNLKSNAFAVTPQPKKKMVRAFFVPKIKNNKRKYKIYGCKGFLPY